MSRDLKGLNWQVNMVIRSQTLGFFGWLIFSFCIGSAPYLHAQSDSFSWPDGKRAAISLSFDDARASQPEIGRDLFRKLGAKATFYVNPPAMEDHLTGWQDILADGHEIGNHTMYHPCTGNFGWSREKALENYNLATMRQELLAANQRVYEMLGVIPVSFAYTCGHTFVGRGADHQSFVPLVAELFESGRGWLSETANDPQFVDLALLQGVSMDNKDFEEGIRPLVDDAIEQGRWLVLGGHEIGTEGAQTTRVDMLEDLIAYVRQHEDELWLAPVGEIAAYVREQRENQAGPLREALRFAATFDAGYDADLAAGDARLHGAPAYGRHPEGTPGLVPEEITLAEDRGRIGHALEFKRKGQGVVFYPAAENLSYNKESWSGTLSLWLSLDPETDLEPGYTDPIQVTDSGYDDAALWVDFTDANPRSFRMGVFGDVAAWNPDKRSPDENPDFTNRLVVAEDRPFQRGRWTHVAITFSALNSGQGNASFYINGKLQGSRTIPESFSWTEKEAKIFLGLNYVGLLDEVAVFNRALSEEEVSRLYELVGGLGTLLSVE